MTFNPTPFDFLAAAQHWLIALGCFLGILLLVSFLTALVALGLEGPRLVLSRVRQGIADLFGISPRRVWALTVLTIREAVRRKALMVFVVFAVLFMFAGWFLGDANSRSDLQFKVYVSFVLTCVSWLTLPVVLILSCWGLPEDIRLRSIHTVVTKPVRKSEIVIGRILGFAGTGSLILLIMGVVGFIWIHRQVPNSLREYSQTIDGRLVEVSEKNDGITVWVTGDDEQKTKYEAKDAIALKQGQPEIHELFQMTRRQALADVLTARVPVYGTIRFRDREGNDKDEKGALLLQGINVGDIFEFRSYIEGGTKATAIWEFAAGPPVDNMVFESRFEAFRTHKGRIDERLICQMFLLNEEAGLRVPLPPFENAEFTNNVHTISRKLEFTDLETDEARTVDLYDEVVRDGKLQVEVQCLDTQQYLGMAQSDLFIRLPDRTFTSSYSKAVLGVWLMMSLTVMLSVTASCFVKGPVAILLTLTMMVVGQGFRDFMHEMVSGQLKGGGPLEASYRILIHMNPQSELPESVAMMLMRAVDTVFVQILWLIENIVPNFSVFHMTPYVANGFDVPWSASMLPSLAVTAAYAVPCLLVGYYSLSMRELESK